ncbi:glycosyltransferase family 4 protein [Candidatus Uhrbacteria bacterium]|nr:glycosyltransferase family 4 protein [Candidatus Uhrbacteria bacterium]
MRIIHLACVAPPVIGGIGRVAYEEVVRLQAQKNDAMLFAPHGEDGRSIRRLPTWMSVGNACIPNLKKLESLLVNADIVHLHYPFYGTDGYISRLRRQGKIKKLVITLHMDAIADNWKGCIFDLHRMLLQKRALQAADVLICGSLDYLANASYAYLLHDPRLKEIPFGVDTERFTPDPINKKRFKLPDEVKTIGFIGGMDQAHAFKGIDILLRAVARLPANIHAQLTGSGSLQASYETLAKELGISERCHFLGRATDDELVYRYRSMDVCAFPSISSAEAFGLVALEAQACGIPVVASDLPGVRTVVKDKQTGFLVPVKDVEEVAAHIRLLLENTEMRHSFGIAARDHVVQNFSWDAHMTKLMQMYRQLIA